MARSLWTGSVSFGLVNIPVRLFPATREHDVHFHQLAPDGSRIHYKRVSEKSGREVDYDKIRKGFETSRGKYVVFEQDELKELRPRSTKTIDIEDFVALGDIDPLYFERTYHLVPNGDAAAKAYALLAGVMEDRERIGVGKVVMRDKQYLCAIRPYGKGLALSTMLFADEVVPQSDVEGLPSRKPAVSARRRRSSPPRSSTRSSATGSEALPRRLPGAASRHHQGEAAGQDHRDRGGARRGGQGRRPHGRARGEPRSTPSRRTEARGTKSCVEAHRQGEARGQEGAFEARVAFRARAASRRSA